MRVEGALPFHGRVVWRTSEQGGRETGPPATPPDHDYAATGFVSPSTAATGLASIVLRLRDRAAWESEADGAWLVVDNVDAQRVTPGDVIIVTEGPREVASFHVNAVDESA